MEEEILEGSEAAQADVAPQDEFSSIREHYESGQTLTDEEMDRIADLAVGYLKEILALFGETSSSIDEYDGEDGELILDVNGGDPRGPHRSSRSHPRRPADGPHVSPQQQDQVLLPGRR